jgi:hypothetical protein
MYTVKHNPDGSMELYKAKLIEKGFTQAYGIDYEETFAPIAKICSKDKLNSILAFGYSNLDWPSY